MSAITALKARAEALRDREDGFTLIELLVVVIIIGILAAIAIPIYIGVQNNAKDSASKSDLTNARTAIVAYYTDKNVYPPTVDATNLTKYGFSGPTGASTFSDVTSGTKAVDNYCLKSVSESTKTFWVNQTTAPTETKPSNCTA